MPTAAVETMLFKPTGLGSSGTSRSLGNWTGDMYFNVLNFGADPTGGSDCSTAVQNCFNAAFGTAVSPHGVTNAGQNHTVFFPPGTYNVRNLILTQVYGGRIIGSGMQSSILQFTGSTSGTTWIIKTDGFENCSIENLRFSGSGVISNHTGLDLDYQGSGSGSVGLRNNRFTSVNFGGCEIGLRIGAAGHGGDANTLINCNFGNNKYGCKIAGAEALGNVVIGGGGSENGGNLTTDLSACFYVAAGSISAFLDGSFAGTQTDIIWDSTEHFAVIGARSESWNYIRMTAGKGIVIAGSFAASDPAHWTPPVSGNNFRNYTPTGGTANCMVEISSGASIVLDGCVETPTAGAPTGGYGILHGNGLIYLRGGTVFANTAWLASFTGTFREFMTGAITFAQRPPGADGCEVAITDAHTTTGAWGEVVSGSGGTTVGHALMRFNGTNWTLVGK